MYQSSAAIEWAIPILHIPGDVHRYKNPYSRDGTTYKMADSLRYIYSTQWLPCQIKDKCFPCHLVDSLA